MKHTWGVNELISMDMWSVLDGRRQDNDFQMSNEPRIHVYDDDGDEILGETDARQG